MVRAADQLTALFSLCSNVCGSRQIASCDDISADRVSRQAMTGQRPGRAVGWKEIAAYLRASERTAQRWQRELGLPVHRAGGSKGYSVFAYTSELDEWLRHQEASPAPDTPAQGEPSTSPKTPKSRLVAFGRQPRRLWVIGGVLLVAAVLAVIALRHYGGEDVGAIGFSGQQLLASATGRVVWSYDFGQSLRELQPGETAFKFQIQDVYGKRGKEVIVAAPLLRDDRGDLSTDALYCFSSRGGKVMWRHSFDTRIRFGGESCGPRWEIPRLILTGHGATRFIWCTICSYPTSVSVVEKVGDGGHSIAWFANYGHLRALNEVRTSKGVYLLAGGINNECNCGALAVLKETEPSGRSPQTGPLFECEGCPTGQPYRYYLFPRSEVNLAAGTAYNGVANILINGEHAQAMTSEGPGPGLADWALYDFSEEFVPRGVSLSDNYWEDHRRLSAEGKIKHPLDDCPERLKGQTVRTWNPQEGWKDVTLPPIASNGDR